jgi:hypothetical protein
MIHHAKSPNAATEIAAMAYCIGPDVPAAATSVPKAPA